MKSRAATDHDFQTTRTQAGLTCLQTARHLHRQRDDTTPSNSSWNERHTGAPDLRISPSFSFSFTLPIYSHPPPSLSPSPSIPGDQMARRGKLDGDRRVLPSPPISSAQYRGGQVLGWRTVARGHIPSVSCRFWPTARGRGWLPAVTDSDRPVALLWTWAQSYQTGVSDVLHFFSRHFSVVNENIL